MQRDKIRGRPGAMRLTAIGSIFLAGVAIFVIPWVDGTVPKASLLAVAAALIGTAVVLLTVLRKKRQL